MWPVNGFFRLSDRVQSLHSPRSADPVQLNANTCCSTPHFEHTFVPVHGMSRHLTGPYSAIDALARRSLVSRLHDLQTRYESTGLPHRLQTFKSMCQATVGRRRECP